MLKSVLLLDRILRGEATRPDVLRTEGIRFPIMGLLGLLVILSAIYGVCMGAFAITGSGSGDPRQMLASAFKVPLLFLLTLIVTLPSLYVFNALLGSRLTPVPLVRLMIAALGVTIAVLASIGPIIAFFSVCTTSYAFMTLLNVVVFAVAGLLGLAFLKRTLNRLTAAVWIPPAPPDPETADAGEDLTRAGPLTPSGDDAALGRHTRTIFAIWMLVFGLVGTQMAWVLRPFIGSPDKAFTWFRPRGSNFFEAVWVLANELFGTNPGGGGSRGAW